MNCLTASSTAGKDLWDSSFDVTYAVVQQGRDPVAKRDSQLVKIRIVSEGNYMKNYHVISSSLILPWLSWPAQPRQRGSQLLKISVSVTTILEELWLQYATNQNVNGYVGKEFGDRLNCWCGFVWRQIQTAIYFACTYVLWTSVYEYVHAEEATYTVRSYIYVVVL